MRWRVSQFYDQTQIDSLWGAVHADADAATITFDMSVANSHSVTLGGNRTLAVTGDQVGQGFRVALTQDGTGSRTVTWWSGIIWRNGSAPTLPTAAGALALLEFFKAASGVYVGDLLTALPPAGGDLAGTYPNPTLAKYYMPVSGFQFSYLSATSLSVSKGSCPDSTNAAALVLANSVTVSLNGTAAGDALTLTGTVATNSSNATVTGTSTLFATEFNPRALAGGGTISSSLTTVTGTGTTFLADVQVNDLIGTAAKGFVQVTAVLSDTSLSVSSSPSSDFANDTPLCVEQPTLRAGTQLIRRVVKIASNTSLTLNANSSATGSGLSAVAGAPYGDGTNNSFAHLFAVKTSGGAVSVIGSTQRTTPLKVTAGTYAYFKRLGAVPLDVNANVLLTSQSGGNRRETHFEVTSATNNLRPLSSGSATSYAAVSLSQGVPPTSTLALLRVTVNAPTATATASVRPSNLPGTPPTSGPYTAGAGSGGVSSTVYYVPTDGQQSVDYQNSVASQAHTFLDILGFVEFLP
jgi:hypothetical protein